MVSTGLRIALLAASLALDVFAVCVGVGVGGGIDRRGKVRIGIAFASAEVLMTVFGALLGALVGAAVGNLAAYVGFAALVGVGIYTIVEARREGEGSLDLSRGWGLLVASLSISLDSLGIGFSIIYIGVPLGVTLLAIAFASVAATTLGLAGGAALGKRIGELAGIVAGIVLTATGLLFVALKALHIA